MKQPKLILMDLGDTIIHNCQFDFQKGLKYLYDEVLSEGLQWDELLRWSENVSQKTYAKRDMTHLEVRFIDYLTVLKTVYGFRRQVALDDVEIAFFKYSTEDQLEPDVLPFLTYLLQKNIPVYIVSNSTFSEKVLWYQLEKHHVSQYIQGIFSSANYLFRKPEALLFEIALTKIQKKYAVAKEEVIFIGNSEPIDMVGAMKAGIPAVWLNRLEESLRCSKPIFIANGYRAIQKWFQDLEESGE